MKSKHELTSQISRAQQIRSRPGEHSGLPAVDRWIIKWIFRQQKIGIWDHLYINLAVFTQTMPPNIESLIKILT